MTDLTVVYDANVLYSAPLRDLLVELALTELFEARWTEEIHSEWMRNVLQNRPDITLEQLTRTKNLMNVHVENCLVTDYEEIIPQLQLPDPGDRLGVSDRTLYVVRFAQIHEWSPLLPAPASGEVISILTRRIKF